MPGGQSAVGAWEAPLEAAALHLVPADSLGWGSLTSGPNLNPRFSLPSTFFSHCRM